MQIRSNSIRVSIRQTIARQTPKSDFGSVYKAGARTEPEVLASLAGIFEQLLLGVEDIERYMRRHSTGDTALWGDVRALKTRLRTVVSRINTSWRAEARANVVENPRTLQPGSLVTGPRVK